MTKNDDKRVPVLRFKGFNDDWALRLLKHFITVSSQKNLDNSFDKFDVLSVSGKYGIVNQIKFQGRSFAGKTLTNYKVVNTNDVVYTKSPIKNNPYGVIKVNKHKSGIVSTLYAVYNPTKYVCSNFVELYFNDNLRLNKYLKPIVNIGAKHDMKIANKEVINHNVIFPEVEEQRQICTLFLKLEKLISLQQRKLKLISQEKKGIQEKIFSKKDNFSSYRLKELANFQKGANIKKEDLLTFGKYKVVHYADLYKYTPIQYSVLHYTDKLMGVKIPNNSLLFPASDVTSNGLARTSLLKDKGSFAGNDVIIATINLKQVNAGFLSYEINYFKRNIIPLITGTTVRHIHIKDLQSLKVYLPSKNEQNKIYSMLNKFDMMESNMKQETVYLNQLKQFLLQNMFI